MTPLNEAGVLEWVFKAEEDFHTARRELNAQDGPMSYSSVCFHCQQCVEK